MKFVALALLTLATPAWADAWNCQLPTHAGIWQVDGGELVVPAPGGARRLNIASDTPDSLVAVSSVGRHVEIAVFDRRRLQARYQTIALDGLPDQQEAGGCVLPGRRVAAEARAVVASVRPRVRKLVTEARNLADQGYTTAANLKLVEAEGFDGITSQERALIGDMRTYVASKPRR